MNKTFSKILVALTVLAFMLACFYDVSSHSQNIEYVEYTVKSGDTLWNISSKYTSNNRDLRETVYEIKDLNGIKDVGNLEPGTKLKVPDYR